MKTFKLKSGAEIDLDDIIDFDSLSMSVRDVMLAERGYPAANVDLAPADAISLAVALIQATKDKYPSNFEMLDGYMLECGEARFEGHEAAIEYALSIIRAAVNKETK